MPTAKELEDKWRANIALGKPFGPQHEDRMREDPAYRANHESQRVDQNDGLSVGTIYYDKKNQRLITIFFRMECAIWDNDEIIGTAEYNPKTGRTHIAYYPTE